MCTQRLQTTNTNVSYDTSHKVLVWVHENLSQLAHLVLLSLNLKTLRLLHINFLLPITIQEGGLDIHLKDGLTIICCKIDDGANSSHLGYQSKSVLKVYSLFLCIPLGN